MPVHKGRDSKGTYFKWGHHGAKYYYGKGHMSKSEAAHKAYAQGAAIKYHSGEQ